MKPRDRIASHLQRILVAAGMALPAIGHGDTSTPKPPGKPDDGKKPDNGKTPEKPKNEREHLGYEVVDMMPAPYIEEHGKLDLKSTPSGCAVMIDGVASGKTPLKGYKLTVGSHAVTLTSPDGKAVQNFIVNIQKDKTTREWQSLEPSPAPKAKK